MADPVSAVVTNGDSVTATTTPTFTAVASGTLLTLHVCADDYKTGDPSGWTQAEGIGSAEGSFHGSYFWFKIADGTETSVAYTIGSASRSTYTLLSHTNINTSSPKNVSAKQNTNTGGLSYTTATSPTTSAGRKYAIAHLGFHWGGAGVHTDINTWLNSYTELAQQLSPSANPNYALGVGGLAFDGGGTTDSGATTVGNAGHSRSGIIAVFNVAADTAATAGSWELAPLAQVPYALSSEASPWAVRAFQPPIPMETWPGTSAATQDATVAAVAIVTAAAMPAPAIQTGSTVAATAIATAAAMSAPTVTAVTAHTATVIATTTGMPAPAVQTGSVVAATVIATTTAMPAPVVGAVTAVTPPVIATVTALPAPAVQTGSVVSAATLATVTALPVPVIDVAGNATVAAVAIATVTALPAPAVQQGQVVSATSIATVTALPVPVVQTGSRVNPPVIATVTALTAPTVSVQTVVAATAVATVTALPAPTVKTGSTVAATVVGTVIVLPTPSIDSNVVSGIQGSVYPRPGSGAAGNVYPQSSGGIIGQVG